MSDSPNTPDGPFMLDATAGKTYAWCACGLSAKQPLCDGAHTGSAKRPVVFKAEATKQLVLCGCKHTRKPPYCDGSHLSQ